jgi:hypothetical protein
VDFGIGDFVLTAKPGNHSRDKTAVIWDGPAVVLEELGPLRFRVQDLASKAIHDLHASHLKRYADASRTPTVADIAIAADAGRGWAIKRISSHRLQYDGSVDLKVIWDCKPPSSTWEPLSRIYTDSPSSVRSYISSLDKDDEDKPLLQAAIKSLVPSRPRRR